MWALDNRTAYAAERNWTRDRDGMHWWIVAVRATFDVTPQGRTSLSDEQSPPVLAPQYWGAPGTSSLRHDSDLLAVKRNTDLLVLAHAHAPRDKPTPTVPVTLRAGALEKRLLVHGQRSYDITGRPTAPLPFITAPIRYEFAFGGIDASASNPAQHRMDERNPVGRGFMRRSTARAGKPAHLIEYPSGDPAAVGPAGFGPIDRAWSPRRELAGTFDAHWAQAKRPLLPDDHDPAFALCAPADQRTGRPFLGGERVELSNMTPEGVWTFEVPRVSLKFLTRFGPRYEQHSGLLTSVIIEPEDRRLAVVWQTALRVQAVDTDYLDVTEIHEHRGSA